MRGGEPLKLVSLSGSSVLSALINIYTTPRIVNARLRRCREMACLAQALGREGLRLRERDSAQPLPLLTASLGDCARAAGEWRVPAQLWGLLRAAEGFWTGLGAFGVCVSHLFSRAVVMEEFS